MFVAKGYDVALRALDGSKSVIRPTQSYALLHDPSGNHWPRCSLLITSFRRSAFDIDDYQPANDYFGYVPGAGHMATPPHDLDRWRFISEVDAIDYWRPGIDRKEGGFQGDYEHDFEGHGYIWDKEYPSLYKLGRAYRLELGTGCVMNWRGIVKP